MDILDTRDLAEELAALADPVEAWANSTAEQRESGEVEYPGLEDSSRFGALAALRDELESYGWRYGITLIPEADFEDYARELAEDIGAIDPAADWPLNRIDWEAAAEDLRQDYYEVEFDGTAYYYREA